MSVGLSLALAVSSGVLARPAAAQVAITLGAQEVYDTNIFLEDDNRPPAPVVVDDELKDPKTAIDPAEQSDGDPNDDFITNLTFGLSGGRALTPGINGAADIRVGALLFQDQTDQDRATLDSLLKLDTTPDLLARPYRLELRNEVRSLSSDISSAEGTATRQSHTMTTTFVAAADEIQLTPNTRLSADYTLSYDLFLGDFTFNSRDDEVTRNGVVIEDTNGADYFQNAVHTELMNRVTSALDAGVYGSVSDYKFTHVEENRLARRKASDLDRVEGEVGLRVEYTPLQSFQLGGKSGVRLTQFNSDTVTETVIGGPDIPDQTTVRERDQDQLTLDFEGHATYLPDVWTTVALLAEQSQYTDVSGELIFNRSVGLNVARSFGGRFRLAAGGRFLQFSADDNLSNPTERYEFTTSASYNLTEALSLTAGWNFTTQQADESNPDNLLFINSEDYTGHRFFIGLTGGIVGVQG